VYRTNFGIVGEGKGGGGQGYCNTNVCAHSAENFSVMVTQLPRFSQLTKLADLQLRMVKMITHLINQYFNQQIIMTEVG
jgi:hypothetical protein